MMDKTDIIATTFAACILQLYLQDEKFKHFVDQYDFSEPLFMSIFLVPYYVEFIRKNKDWLNGMEKK